MNKDLILEFTNFNTKPHDYKCFDSVFNKRKEYANPQIFTIGSSFETIHQFHECDLPN